MHSIFHAQCGLKKTYLPRRRFGVTGHVTEVEGMGSHVEILLHPAGEIYVAPCGDMTLVALLLEERAMTFFKGDLPGQYMSFLRSAPGFGERVSRSEPIPPVSAVGPLGFTVEPCYRPGLLLVGDSAGFLDPITGEGMTLALKSMQAATPVIREAFARDNYGADVLARYAEERSHLVTDLYTFTRLLLNLSRYKYVANRAIRRLARNESLRRKLLGIITGTHRYSALTLGERCSLFCG